MHLAPRVPLAARRFALPLGVRYALGFSVLAVLPAASAGAQPLLDGPFAGRTVTERIALPGGRTLTVLAPLPGVPAASAATVASITVACTVIRRAECTDPSDPNTCTSTVPIEMAAPGEEVVAMYSVNNTGTVELTRHNLADAVTGPILTDFAFTLLPGGSAFITDLSNAPALRDVQARLATWEANDMGANSASDSDDYVLVTGHPYANATPVVIPDNVPAGVTSTIVVPPDGVLTELGLNFSITHTWVGDLIVKLRHDDTGTQVTLVDLPGAPASPAGCSSNDMNVVLLDGGVGGTIESACVGAASASQAYPSTSHTPNNPLAAFNGEMAAGTWTLTVSDNVGADTGTLNFWELLVVASGGTAGEPVPPDAMREGYLLETAAPNPVRGRATVGFALARAGHVTLTLHDALGRMVATLYDGVLVAGRREEARLDVAGLPGGVYAVRLAGPGVAGSRRLTVVR